MGDLHWYTRIKIVHDCAQCTITISQDLYICDILEHFNMAEAHPTTTPMATKLKLEKLDTPTVDIQLYQSTLGSVMYTMTGTCPDLAYAIGYLSRHSGTPRDKHLSALKRVYHYLIKPKTQVLCLTARSQTLFMVLQTQIGQATLLIINPLQVSYGFSAVLQSAGAHRNSHQSYFPAPKLSTLP